ncbi:hypothetical protein OESDEN_20350 [Oesophagostomum dentatum]|uniref:ATP-dependent DNA helicase n=1 Tax=Oesophagostomum dentatum TaxID=61180 RepID=A0A0B1S9S3_OESDE|nr:hypothetical protein OESDEN_20350 [Oesophagostomum dentatum]
MTRQSLSEAPVAPKQALESVGKLLRDIMQMDASFGGIIVLLGDDFRKVLPVVRRGGKRERLLIASKIVTLAALQGNKWKKYLLEVGNGHLPVSANDEIPVPQELLSTGSLVDEIYPPFLNGKCYDLSKMIIVTPRKVESLQISDYALERMPGDELSFSSVDSIITEDPSDMLNMPTEFLNKMTPPGFLPHQVRIKPGCIVMLLRNLDLKKAYATEHG